MLDKTCLQLTKKKHVQKVTVYIYICFFFSKKRPIRERESDVIMLVY